MVASDDLYGGSFRLFDKVRKRSAGMEFTFVDFRDPAKVEAAITDKTKLIWCETPTNPMLRLCDLEAIAAIAKRRGVMTCADTTFASRRAAMSGASPTASTSWPPSPPA